MLRKAGYFMVLVMLKFVNLSSSSVSNPLPTWFKEREFRLKDGQYKDRERHSHNKIQKKPLETKIESLHI